MGVRGTVGTTTGLGLPTDFEVEARVRLDDEEDALVASEERRGVEEREPLELVRDVARFETEEVRVVDDEAVRNDESTGEGGVDSLLAEEVDVLDGRPGVLRAVGEDNEEPETDDRIAGDVTRGEMTRGAVVEVTDVEEEDCRGAVTETLDRLEGVERNLSLTAGEAVEREVEGFFGVEGVVLGAEDLSKGLFIERRAPVIGRSRSGRVLTLEASPRGELKDERGVRRGAELGGWLDGFRG